MKNLLLLGVMGLFATTLSAKQVTTCMSYLVGATSKMECSGDFNGEATMVEMYKKGWRYIGDIGGTSRFVLIFEK